MTSEEFDELIDKYMSGKASPEEERLIDEFFRSQQKKTSPQYRNDLPSDSMWRSIENRISKPTKVRKAKRLSPKLVLVCMTVFIVSLGLWYSFDHNSLIASSEVQQLTSTTGRGQKSTVTLSDGSRVYLNSGSFISYPVVFSSDKREITLSGEAFFEVSRDEKRPFIIQAGNVKTEVLGTSFNIQAFDPKTISVTVATGKVQVEASSGNAGSAAYILTPNQQAVYSQSKGIVTSDVDIERFIAWKSNTIHFEDTPLEEAVPVLERWFNVTIEFESNAIRNCRINGKYKDQTLTGVMKSIQYMYPIEYKLIEDNKLILYGKGCNP